MVDRIHARLNVHIEVLKPLISVEEQALTHGDSLHILQPDACCAIRKVEPTARMLSGLDAWITALRRDQGPTRAHLPAVEEKMIDGRRLTKVNPLIHWTKAEVWRHILENDLPYNPLHDQGYPSIGCAPCTEPASDPNDERSGRWAGRGKTECGLHTFI
jgi:phosphoadenosine phosphosulfate reductase